MKLMSVTAAHTLRASPFLTLCVCMLVIEELAVHFSVEQLLVFPL